MRHEGCANCQVRYDDDDEKRIFDAKEGARCPPRALSVVYCIVVSICFCCVLHICLNMFRTNYQGSS